MGSVSTSTGTPTQKIQLDIYPVYCTKSANIAKKNTKTPKKYP